MSYIRIKSIKSGKGKMYSYAYLVKSVWYKRKYGKRGAGPRQKVIAYIGRVMGLEGFIVKRIFERDGYQCQTEDCYMQIDLTIDHIIPILKGGTNDDDNLQTLCKRCNHKKGTSLHWKTKPRITLLENI